MLFMKKEMKQVKWSGMRVVERSTKTTLQMDEAVLPQGDFLLFLVPEKVKSGKKTSGGADQLSGPIENCKYNELRSHMSWLNREKAANLDMSGGTPELQKTLKKYYKKSGSIPVQSAAKPAAKKPAAKPTAEKVKAAKVAEYKPTPKQKGEDDEDYADRLAYEKKAFDKKAKKAAIAEVARLAKVKAEKEEKEKEEKAAADKKAAKAEKPAKKEKKKGFFAKKDKAPSDPIEIIENSRNQINKAVDEIVEEVINSGGSMADASTAVLRYTEKGLDDELKKIRNALRTSRSSASYID